MNPVTAQKLERLRKAVNFEKLDRIPVSINGGAFLARTQKLPMKDYVSDFPAAVEAGIAACRALGDVDSIQSPILSPYILSTQWFSPVAVPGIDLPDDDLWQVVEQETLEFEDYQYILDNGFGAFFEMVMQERLDHTMDKLQPFFEYNPIAVKSFDDAGIPVINGACFVQPFEYFCGGRTLGTFFADDLMDEPELLDEVFRITHKYNLDVGRAQMAQMKPWGAWVGGWRSAPQMLSPAMWNQFVWPYMKEMAEMVIEFGGTPIFHLDSCWDREFEAFKQLPAHKCILSLDGTSDIRLARKVLGDHSCLMGDVPAQLLAFGSPGEVFEHTTALIRDVGPETGYIVCSGCDIPSNAKFENVKAMVDAAHQFL